jgi:hypothetical protein
MEKIKAILAIGVIVLFLGVTVSPATAQTSVKNQLEVSASGGFSPVQLSERDLASLQKVMPTLLEKISKAKSYQEVMTTLQNSLVEYGRMPGLVLILTLIIKAIHFNFKINQLRPVRRAAFVLSWGFTNKFIALGKNKINVLRPITWWYYSGKSNFILNSRTIILDPYPFSIKMLTGRQIGLMTNFGGIYIHRDGPIAQKAITFFFGVTGTVRGFDLSPFNK